MPMKTAVVTSPHFFVEENAIIEGFFEAGLDLLHIRKPDSDPLFCERLLTLIPSRWRKRIIVHDHFYLKDEYSLKGIHLTIRNQAPPKNYNGFMTRSCNDIDELRQWSGRCGYVLMKATEENLHRAQTEGLINSNVFAKEAMNIEDIHRFRKMGFGGVVFEHTLWDKFDSFESSNYKDLINFFKELRKAAY